MHRDYEHRGEPTQLKLSIEVRLNTPLFKLTLLDVQIQQQERNRHRIHRYRKTKCSDSEKKDEINSMYCTLDHTSKQ